MSHHKQFYINGKWVEPKGDTTLDVINPATEEAVAAIALGNKEDVDLAVAAARNAFESYSNTSREERIALLERVMGVFKKRVPLPSWPKWHRLHPALATLRQLWTR